MRINLFVLDTAYESLMQSDKTKKRIKSLQFFSELAFAPLPDQFICARTIDTSPMFFPIHPVTLILFFILVNHLTVAISFSLYITSLIYTSVGPSVLSESVLLVVEPFAFVALPVLQL